MPILSPSCVGSAPIRTPGLKPSRPTDPNSASPPDWFPACAVMQIVWAGAGSRAPPWRAPFSEPHSHDRPDATHPPDRDPRQICISVRLACLLLALFRRSSTRLPTTHLRFDQPLTFDLPGAVSFLNANLPFLSRRLKNLRKHCVSKSSFQVFLSR